MADLGTPTKFKTFWVIVIVAVALIGWDVYLAYSPTQPTISALTLFLSDHPVVPFLAGVLAGHLFWPQVEKKDA
jgi:hypothetical protein